MLTDYADIMTPADFVAGSVGTYVTGEWTPGVAIPLVVIQIVIPQPIRAEDLEILEDGERAQDFRVTWTETELRTREGARDADQITYNGVTYKVKQVSDRSALGNFYRAVMRKLDSEV